MSKFEDCVKEYQEEFDKLGVKYDADLLKKVTKACGPSIYLPDASKVSSTDPEELARVRNNFLIKKLGLADNDKLDAGIQAAIDTLGSSNRKKYRAMFYYLLTKHFKKESTFK